ncbi:MAG: transposase [Syntrophomonas sp.]|nr:transposase [Syntrophomonas sp.]
MTRQARKKSASGIYHIMMRGINRQTIFEDQDDYTKFLQTLKQYKEISGYQIYAYCLMGNHVHLLLKVGEEPLEQVMRRICGSYVYWYNWKYQRIGNLFQDRFKSETIENDSYFLTALRYIHQNPLKAGLVKNIKDYQWSSISEYINRSELIDNNFALKMFDADREKAVQSFIQFCKTVSDDQCLEMEDKRLLSDPEAKDLIKKVCQVKNALDLQKLDKAMRNEYLKQLKEEHHLSIRQIERLTGINRGVIFNA